MRDIGAITVDSKKLEHACKMIYAGLGTIGGIQAGLLEGANIFVGSTCKALHRMIVIGGTD